MVLQYKGFNNNWIYEEAEVVTYATVWIGKITRDYRGKDTELNYITDIYESVNKFIIDETHCSDEIIYKIGDKQLADLENVVVVILSDKNKDITYVFDKGVYLLNNKGQTVQKLA